MTEATGYSALVNLGYTFAAFLLIWFLPRFHAWSTKKGFQSHVWPELEKGNVAIGIYAGLRLFAIYYLAASLVR